MTRIPAFLALAAAAFLAAPAHGGNAAHRFAHELKPGAIAEECMRLEAGSARRFEWTADQPVEFNIHFHHGDKVSYPVKLAGRKAGSGSFRAAASEDYCWMWTAKTLTRISGSISPEP